MGRLRTAILISGRGTNMQALLDYCSTTNAAAEIKIVVSNIPDAFCLKRANEAGIPTEVINHKLYSDRDAFESAITKTLKLHNIELICLAGFMRLLTSSFVDRWRDKIINIHPSLLPAFKGINTHERALEAGVRFSGCTVHYVRAETDCGPIIIQAVVPVLPEDNADSLAARVLAAEHRCFPQALSLIARGKTQIVEEKVLIQGNNSPDTFLFNPNEKF
jgi:phosphoribosylglycinamide formyltransferase-1